MGNEEQDIREALRAAGLARTTEPSLEDIERRRSEVLGLTLFVFLAVAGGVLLLSFAPQEMLDQLGGALTLVRLGLFALAAAFVAYFWEKERRLRKLTKALVNERVVSAALTNQLRDVSLLAKAGRAVTSTLDLRRTLSVILDAAGELLGADEGSILLADDDDLVVTAAVGRLRILVNERHPRSDGVAGYVLRTGQSVLIDGELEHAELAAFVDNPIGRERTSLSSISVPMQAMGEGLGVINLNITQGDRRYSEYDRQTLELFAHHAAIAVYQDRVLGSGGDRSGLADVDRMRSDMMGRIAGDVDRLTTGSPEGKPKDARRHISVLAVDDDAAILRTLEIALEADGYDVLLAGDGKTALGRIEAEDPDVVLLDLAIPVVDGWRVLQELEDRPDRPRVICLTARSARRDRMRAWMLGVDEYLVKPFEVNELPLLIDAVLNRTAEAQEERREEALRELFAVG